ncbi:MAG TPA: methyltransferase domain-containing protein [Gemmatimonadales bacterium]|nr:methyltransferase domain-containing protein [Gemmatimonadales bacterium]
MTRLRDRLHRFFPTMRNVLVRRSMRAIDLSHAKSVLVVGAGHDPYRHLFPSASTYVRSDIDRHNGSTDVVSDGMALPFPDGSFQCAVATEVLEYVQRPRVFAAELHRVLGHDGFAVVTVPFVFQDHGDYWRPTRRSLGELFQDFSSVDIYAQGNRFHTMMDLVTTAFTPWPVLYPLRVLSNLMFLVPARFATTSSRSTAPSGFLVIAKK